MNPKIVHKPAFTVVGMKVRSSMEQSLIPQLWSDFDQRHDEIRDWIEPDNCYGICLHEEGDDAQGCKYFSYLAGIEVSNTDFIPAGMTSHTLPEADYAVFEHHGPLDKLQDTYKFIYGSWLPHSAYKVLGKDDFELYDTRFKYGQAESVMEIWVPIVKK